MWPSKRLASNDLESAGQGVAQARRRDRRGIRPIVTLLEERFLLSTPGTIQIAPDISPGGNNAVIVNIITDSNASGQPVTVNEGVYACPFNIIDTNGVTHTDDALSVDLNATVGTGPANVQPIAIGLSNSASPTWPGYNINFNATQGNQLAWLEQAFTNAKNQPGGATSDQYAALQVEAWTIIDPHFTFAYSSGGGGQADFQANYDTLQFLAGGGSDYQTPAADCLPSFAGTVPYGMAADGVTPLSVIPNYPGTLLSLDPAADGTQQYQNLITPADNTLGVYGALPTINVTGYDVTYDGQAHTATGTATTADGINLSNLLDLSQTTNINATSGTATGGFSDSSPESWTFNSPTNPSYNPAYQTVSGVVNVEINQAPATITITATPGLVYDGLYQALDTGTATGINGTPLSSSDVNVSWGLQAGTYTSNTATNPWGTPNSWFFSDPSGNYAYESGTSPTNTIAQADAPIVVTPIAGLVYNGDVQVTATGTVTGINLENYPGALTLSATHTNAGTYDDSWSFTDPTGNYASKTGTMQDTIAQAPLTISAIWASKTYDGNTSIATTEAVPTATGLVSLNDWVTGMTEAFASPNAGSEATVVASYTIAGYNGGNNYKVTLDQGIGLITPTDANVSVTPISNTIYNYGMGTPTTGLIYEGVPQETASYSATGVDGAALPSSDFTDLTVHTDAGTYTDTWTFSDPNYNSQSGNVTNTIQKATDLVESGIESTNITEFGPGQFTMTYGTPLALTASVSYWTGGTPGNPYAPTAAEEDGTGHAVFATSLEGVNAVVDFQMVNANGTLTDLGSTAPTNVGEYHVNATFAGSADFLPGTFVGDNGDGYDTLYITPATANITPSFYAISYDGQAHAPTATVTGINGVVLAHLTGTSMTNAGVDSQNFDYIDPSGNYSEARTITGRDYINKAAAAVNVTGYNVVYNGQSHSATGKATGINSVALPSTDLTLNTTHTSTGTYTDTWTFTDPNYVSQTGTVTDTIVQANAPATLNQVLVEEDYRVLLNRAAEPEGLTYWSTLLNNGATPNSVGMGITNSTESLTDIVINDYQGFLNRAPEPGGLNCWLGQLQSGRTPDQVAAGILGSAEYFADHGSTNQGFVTSLYQNVLGRAPDSGGNAFWLNALASGASRTQVAFGFLTSPEAAAKQTTSADYSGILNRSPDAGGLNFWVGTLTGPSPSLTNQQVAVDFIDSAENINRIDIAIAQMADATIDQIAMSLLGSPDRDSQGG